MYTWHDFGNLLSTGIFTYTYTYDAAGRMVRAESATATVVYTYTGDGLRLAMSVNGALVTYVQDVGVGLPQVLLESAGGQITTYLYGRDRLAQILPDGDVEWFLTDDLGSVRQVVDTHGSVVAFRSFDPYGQLDTSAGTSVSGYGYAGEQRDSATGLIFLRARYYDPGTGRFTAKDSWLGSLTQPQDLHKYAYTANNPVNEVDPSGYCSQKGWRDSSGLYTRENCNRLEAGDLDFTKQWYSDFADDVEHQLPQTATHFRYFLSNAGGEYRMPERFVENDILGIGRLKRSIDGLTEWYVQKHVGALNPCRTMFVGSDVYARGFTPNYGQVAAPWLLGTDELDVCGSLGTFRVDVELTGALANTGEGSPTDAVMTVHVIALDVYDWHGNLGVEWEGNAISDQWAKNLADNKLAANFIVRGDHTYSTRVTTSRPILGVRKTAPRPWFWAQYIGSQFSVFGATGKLEDYAGNPMR